MNMWLVQLVVVKRSEGKIVHKAWELVVVRVNACKTEVP